MINKKFCELIAQLKQLFIATGPVTENVWSVDPAIRNFSISNAGKKVLVLFLVFFF